MTTMIDPYAGYSSTPPELAGDFAPADPNPRIKICQPGSEAALEAGCKPGDFYLTQWEVDDESIALQRVIYPVGNSLTFAPMAFREEAVFFEDGKPICRSDDGVTCQGEYAQAANFKRSACPHSQFRQEEGKSKPPACPSIHLCLGYSPQVGIPASVEFSKSSMPAFKEMVSAINRTGKGKVAATLTLQKNSSGRISYYVPQVGWVDPDDAFALQQQGLALVKEIQGGGSPPLALVAGQPAQAPDPEPEPQARPSSWSPPPPSANLDDLPF